MQGEGGDISVLPEGCISTILSFTSPREAGVSCLVSSTFKSAADSDVCWQKFLPSNYNEIISRSSDSSSFSLNDFPSKKQLYLHLCDHSLLLDGGKMSFHLEKKSGKKCFMISAKELAIIWGDNPQFWTWQPHPDSRFAEVAELVAVCWLDIKGTIQTRMLSPKTTYAAYLVIKFVDDAYGLDHEACQVSVQFVRGVGDASGSRDVHLIDTLIRDQVRELMDESWMEIELGEFYNDQGEDGELQMTLTQTNCQEASGGQFPSERGDGWMEIELGEFYNDQGEDGEVQMTLTEIKGGHWKSGLTVQGIELRPKVSI